MCTNAKNSCSLRQGFSPEMLVFGKGLRVPGSNASDDEIPSHITATEGSSHSLQFRQQLARRETARRAFFAADNEMAIRRAALRRSCPHRIQYSPGEWVMVWRSSENSKGWIRPAKVIQQDGSNVVYCHHQRHLLRAAPEHVRPVSAVEARLVDDASLPQLAHDHSVAQASSNSPPETIPPISTASQHIPNHDRHPSSMSQDQPDQKPEAQGDSNQSTITSTSNRTFEIPEHNI